MVIWTDIGVKIRHKCIHIRKIGGKVYNSFITDYGDIPVSRYNTETGKLEKIVNNRGRAYAARKRMVYRKPKNR